jgi:hypothetical protein
MTVTDFEQSFHVQELQAMLINNLECLPVYPKLGGCVKFKQCMRVWLRHPLCFAKWRQLKINYKMYL